MNVTGIKAKCNYRKSYHHNKCMTCASNNEDAIEYGTKGKTKCGMHNFVVNKTYICDDFKRGQGFA